MSRLRHRHHRGQKGAGEKKTAERARGGLIAHSEHLRGEGVKNAARPDRRSRRKRSFGGVIARADGGSTLAQTVAPDREMLRSGVKPGAIGAGISNLSDAAGITDYLHDNAERLGLKHAKGGRIKKRASGGELGEVLDTPPSSSSPPPSARDDLDSVAGGASVDATGPGSGVVPPQDWRDMTLGQIESAVARRLHDIPSPSELTPRQIGLGALKVAMAPGLAAAKAGAAIRDSMSPSAQEAADSLGSSIGSGAGKLRDAISSYEGPAWAQGLPETLRKARDVAVSDVGGMTDKLRAGLDRIRAMVSPAAAAAPPDFAALAKDAIARHPTSANPVPHDTDYIGSGPDDMQAETPMTHAERVAYAKAAGVKPSARDVAGSFVDVVRPSVRAPLYPAEHSGDLGKSSWMVPRKRGGKVKHRDGGGAANQQETQGQQQTSGLAQIGNETPQDRAGQIDPQTGKPYTRAKGGWVQGAISHPGRMKRGAERAGMSTHEYMEKHKGDSGSLGSAARLGLRLSAASKGKKEL